MPPDDPRSAPAPARERRVMLCSPDPDLSAQIFDALSGRGYTIERVGSAADALAAVAGETPDLLICDDAPSLDAMALLHQLRQMNGPVQAMPVVVLSSFGTPADIAMGKRAGADDFLAKPVGMDLLEATILSQLRLVDRIRGTLAPKPQAEVPPVALTDWCALVDMLSFGVIMSDRTGRPLYVNSAARKLGSDNPARLRAWARPWPHAIDDTLLPEGILGLRLLSPDSMSGAPDSALVIAHLDLGRTDPDASCLVTLLFSPSCANQGARLIASVLGLTPTETLVADHLATGKRREEIAEVMSVTMPTVNYHLRNIYQKSGTTRQSDAVRLLLSVPLAGPTADDLPPSGRG